MAQNKFFQFLPSGINYDFLGFRNRFIPISLIAIICSIILISMNGLNFGIDFSGGTEIQIRFNACVEAPAGATKKTSSKQNAATTAPTTMAANNTGCVPRNMLSTRTLRSQLAKMFPGSEPDIQPVGVMGNEFILKFNEVSFLKEAQIKDLEQRIRRIFASEGKDLKDSALVRFDFRSEGGNKIDVAFARRLSGVEHLEKDQKKEDKAKADDKKAADATTKPTDAATKPTTQDSRTDFEKLKQILANFDIQLKAEDVKYSGYQDNNYEYTIEFEGLGGKLREKLTAAFNEKAFEILQVESVGPRVGKKLRNDGIISLLLANLFILIYIAIRFDFRYAPGAVVALLHDVTLTAGIFSLLQITFDLTAIAALLTIVGYSLNDTIVVYDRIRENWQKSRVNFGEVINRSINETLNRTLLTSATTFIAVLPIFLIGGINIKWFAFAMMFGILVGTYSSLGIASPIVFWLDQFFNKKMRDSDQEAQIKREKRRLRRAGLVEEPEK
jgi:preprotein translocase subunit SecF